MDSIVIHIIIVVFKQNQVVQKVHLYINLDKNIICKFFYISCSEFIKSQASTHGTDHSQIYSETSAYSSRGIG